MRVVIIEGSINGSEGQFWKVLNELKFNDVYLEGAKGHGEVLKILKRLYETAYTKWKVSQECSNILICLDTTALQQLLLVIKGNISEFLSKAGSHKASENTWSFYSETEVEWLRVDMLPYYCFEDCLLFFSDFSKWVYSKQRIEGGSLDYELKLLHNYQSLGVGEDIEESDWKSDDELRLWVKSTHPEFNLKFTTREKLAYYLLEDVLLKDTYFSNSKTDLAWCWTCDCRYLAVCSSTVKRNSDNTERYRCRYGNNHLHCKCMEDWIYYKNKLLDNGNVTYPELENKHKEKLNKECGFFSKLDKPTTLKKINELIEKSPILKYIYDHYTWLYE